MLRILLISFFLYGCSSQIKTFEYVVYDQSIMPSCAIKFTDEYWQWRYAQSGSDDIKRDVARLYDLYLQSIKLSGESIELSNERVMCNSVILMSPELARIMNSLGKNTSPMSFYYGFISQIANLNIDKKLLAEHEIEKLAVSVIQKNEEKFLHEKTAQ